MNVLQKITNERKQSVPPASKYAGITPEKNQKDVIAALRRKSKLPSLISEIKRKSPSKGEINPGMTVSRALDLYRPWASAVSVLTEPNYFGGKLEDLKEASGLVDLPLLRKDFITDPIEIKEARINGASFFLLIQGVLSHDHMAELLDAGREYNMPALIEVHDEAELEAALEHDIQILGVNNRNLIDLTIDLKNTEQLISRIPEARRKELILVSESGLSSRADLEALPEDVDAVLIGTAFMKSSDPEALLREMFSQE